MSDNIYRMASVLALGMGFPSYGFEQSSRIPLEPREHYATPEKLTKRQRRRLRGKAREQSRTFNLPADPPTAAKEGGDDSPVSALTPSNGERA